MALGRLPLVTGRVATVLVLVTMLAAACTRNSPTANHSPTPVPSPGAIAWTDCGRGFQCGNLDVPLDYDHPDGRKISLAVARVPARDNANRIGSLLLNPGGPGYSGIEFLRGDLSSLRNLNRSRRNPPTKTETLRARPRL